MLTVRLQRTGKKNQSDFRIVLAEKTASASKKFVEVLGRYNPRKKLFQISNQDRLNNWISKGVSLSPTVHNLFVSNKLLSATKVHAFNIPKKKEVQAENQTKISEDTKVESEVQVSAESKSPEGQEVVA